MFKSNIIISILFFCGSFLTFPLQAYTVINNNVQVGPAHPPITILPPPPPTAAEAFGQGLGEGLGLALQEAMERRKVESNVSSTKQAALIAWVGGKKKICQNCYEANLELKKRVELTTLFALQLQSIGYSLADSTETAKTAVMADMGGCYIPICEMASIKRRDSL